jgi:hypothetical protein
VRPVRGGIEADFFEPAIHNTSILTSA